MPWELLGKLRVRLGDNFIFEMGDGGGKAMVRDVRTKLSRNDKPF